MPENDDNQESRLSKGVWALAICAGIAAWIAVGWFWTDGGGEIAMIFTSTFIMVTAIAWAELKAPWFVPLLMGWVAIHAAVLFFWVLPLDLHRSKGFLFLYTVDGLALCGLISLARRIWGGAADESEPT